MRNTGIDTIIVAYPTVLRSVRAIPEASLSASGCRRKKTGFRWMVVNKGWRAHIEGGHLRPRRTVIRLDTGNDGEYRAPMRPGEIIARLMEACGAMGSLWGWEYGTVRRVDYTLDERRAQSPAPQHIPHFYLYESYPCGGALFLAGKRRPASRAIMIYDKTVALQLKSGKDDDETWPHIWRTELRFSTRASAKKAGISSVEDALTALLVWDVIAPMTPCEMLPETFSTAWRRVRSECSSLADVRRVCARIRASLRRGPEDRPRKEIIAAVKGGERREHRKKAKSMEDHALKNGICISREREGKGGGGFPTGLKWEFASKFSADQKYVICNADEGDPGAFMDRSVLEGDPHSVIEAMAICGYAIGATKGMVYIRAEYPLAVQRLRKAIQDAREVGLLGDHILGSDFSFDIELRYGAGAFVCGEETGLIRSLEGERGEPTSKPPFPAESGYWGKPSNVNNVETFACVPVIYQKGAEWFARIGTEKSKGTKVFALAGKVNNVGLVEVPMGTTLREVIFDIGGGIRDGKKFKAVQTGGPSGGCLTTKHLDTPIDFDNLVAAGSMMGSGGMIVIDEDNCMVSLARFYLEFTVEESCGKCTPCRVGNKRLHEILTKICQGRGTEEDLVRLRDLAKMIKDTSLCGLGQTAPNPVLSTLEHFWDEYVAHVREKRCPAGMCKDLVKIVIDAEKCKGCTMCAKVCPTGAISGKVREAHVIDQEKCVKCGACIGTCKFGAISKQ